MKITITFLAILVFATNIIQADIIRIDGIGSFYNSSSIGIVGPANDYFLDDIINISITYDSIQLNSYSYISANDWKMGYESDAGIIGFGLTIQRDGEIIETAEGLDIYKLQQTNSFAYSEDYSQNPGNSPMTFEVFAFSLYEEIPSYPGLQGEITLSFSKGEDGYTDTPFYPSQVLYPVNFSYATCILKTTNWLSSSVSSGYEAYNFIIEDVSMTIVPEPASLLILFIGGIGLLRRRYNKVRQ